MTSQKTLLAFAIVSVVVSLFAIYASFSAYTTLNDWIAFSPGLTKNQTLATVNVTIESNLAIKFTNDTINWGSGAVTGTFANLTSEGQFTGWLNSTPANVSNGFVLENVGTINATLWIKTDKNASNFTGAINDGERFLYKARNCFVVGDCGNYAGMRDQPVNDLANSCGGTVIPTFGNYANVNSSTSGSYLGDRVCTQYGWENDRDELRIDINIVIPDSASVGAKGAIMTAQAEMPI